MKPAPDTPPNVSPILQRAFGRYARRYVRKRFHAVRLARVAHRAGGSAGLVQGLDVADDIPIVIVFNHPSWWDPMMGFVLAHHLLPGRLHYGPIDAEALGRYRFLERLGLFPVELETVRGARAFWKTALAIAATPRTALWIAPQGRFVDPRERPLLFEPGLSRLLSRLERGLIVPLALEYPFWFESRPEALLGVGDLVHVGNAGRSAQDWDKVCRERLEEAQDGLRDLSVQRAADAFETLVDGSAGVGWVYDACRWVRARMAGERFSREHRELGPS